MQVIIKHKLHIALSKNISYPVPMNIINKLIDHYGNAYRTAKALGISHQRFYLWQSAGFIPFRNGKMVEEKTAGLVKAVEIWEEASKALAKKVE